MLFRRPCYYDKFTCTADKCTDNCCIGWEICIDEHTADYYSSADGDFGKRLKENINFGNEPSFILKNERCPFLNEKNLCDIISTLGENSLCQICRDHPRWFEWYGNEKEGGTGLSCEESARLILQEENFADYFESEIEDDPDEDFDENGYRFLLSVRDEIFDILYETDKPIECRADKILKLSAKAEAVLIGSKTEKVPSLKFDRALSKVIPVLEKTEPVNEIWSAEFQELKQSPPAQLKPDKNEEEYLSRLFAYFIWRYFLTSVFDYQVSEKVRFAFFSVTTIFALYKQKNCNSFDALLKSAVLYSKQMEYSTENLDILFSYC